MNCTVVLLIFSSFDAKRGSVGIGSTQQPHFYFKLDREETAKPQVAG